MSKQSPAGTPTRMIGMPTVKDRVSLSEATIWRLRKKFLFPEPVRLSPGRVAWKESDIENWLAERARETELRRVG
jgi:prophage regulatory protein